MTTYDSETTKVIITKGVALIWDVVSAKEVETESITIPWDLVKYLIGKSSRTVWKKRSKVERKICKE